jgi:hypothetical protein
MKRMKLTAIVRQLLLLTSRILKDRFNIKKHGELILTEVEKNKRNKFNQIGMKSEL